MEQLLIEVDSEDTSAAIKEFVGRFADASVSVHEVYDDRYYIEHYGLSKSSFEQNLNIGLAQAVLSETQPWGQVKEEILARISKR